MNEGKQDIMNDHLAQLAARAALGELAKEFVLQLQLQLRGRNEGDAAGILVAASGGARSLDEAIASVDIHTHEQFLKLAGVINDRLSRLRVTGQRQEDRDERLNQLLSIGETLAERLDWYGLRAPVEESTPPDPAGQT